MLNIIRDIIILGDYMNKYIDVWNKLHKDFSINNKPKYDDWLDEFKDIIDNVSSEIIDLGCGVTGNNTLYLLEKGKRVLSCDFAEEALKVVDQIEGSKTLLFDMLDKFPFEDNYTDLIIADLSLHYFSDKDTKRIIKEIKRVLKPNGYLFFRVNSINSTEYKEIISKGILEKENNLFFYNNMDKRFFDDVDIRSYFNGFKIILLREENMNRWCPDKIIWKGVACNEKDI